MVAASAYQGAGPPSANVVLIQNKDHLSPQRDSEVGAEQACWLPLQRVQLCNRPRMQVMMLHINGDAVLGLTRLMNYGPFHKERPLSMDLLWSVRSHARLHAPATLLQQAGGAALNTSPARFQLMPSSCLSELPAQTHVLLPTRACLRRSCSSGTA